MSIVDDFIPIYSKNKTKSIAALFEARKFYEDSTIPFITGSYIDYVLTPEIKIKKIPFSNLYRENGFFGVIDNQSDIILPKKINTNFSSIGQKDGKEILVQNFVADAFNAMKNFLDTQLIKNGVNSNSPFYNIKPIKGYESIDNLYTTTILNAAENFKSICLKDKKLDSEIKNNITFNTQYIKFLKSFMFVSPVTKSRTVAYYNMSSYTSGLMIQLKEDDTGDDVNKYVNYMLDEGFICFSEACARFGFKFDKHLPFIVIADIKSEAMKPYLQKYGLSNIENIFEQRYYKVFYEDIDNLKVSFYNSYKLFLQDNTYYYENLNNVCSKDASKLNAIARENISFDNFIKKYEDTYWMRIYVYFKILELNLDYTQQQFENIVRTANDYIKFGKIKDALKFVNSKFNETAGSAYFNSLLPPDPMLQSDDPPVGFIHKPNIIL